MKLDFVPLLIFLALIAFMTGGYVKNLYKNAQTIPTCPETIICEIENYSSFEKATSKIGSRTYDREKYNCVDFSQDLVKELEKANIKSSIAINQDRSHAFVIVYIEATKGNFISPDKDLKILELRDENMHVICD